MLINNNQHKEQLRRSFNSLLSANGMKLSDFCKLNELNYTNTYQTVFRYANIDLVKFNELVQMVDNRKQARVINEKWVISAKF